MKNVRGDRSFELRPFLVQRFNRSQESTFANCLTFRKTLSSVGRRADSHINVMADSSYECAL
jgi:hypothetical protein